MRKLEVITLNCGCLYSTRSPSELWGRGCAQQFREEPEYTICPVILLTNPDTQKVKVSPSVLSNSLGYHGWKSPGKKTGVSCHSPLQGIFLTQGSNPGLLHCMQSLGHQGSPYPDTQISRLTQSAALCTWASRTWRHLDEPQRRGLGTQTGDPFGVVYCGGHF